MIGSLPEDEDRVAVETSHEGQYAEAHPQQSFSVFLTENRAEALFEILDNIEDPILAIDRSGRVVLANRAGREFAGVEHDQVSYQQLWKLFYVDGTSVPRERTPCYRAFRGERIRNEEYVLQMPEGSCFQVMVSAAPVREHGQEPLVVVSLRDVTRLRELEEERDDLIRAASHDLRSPLAVLNAQAQLLHRKLSSQAGHSEALRGIQVILKTTRQMSQMIDDLLLSMRLDNDPKALHKVPVDVADLVSDLVERMSLLEGASRIRCDVAPDLPVLLLDHSRIQRAVANLIQNALKFSEPDTLVFVRSWAADGWIYVSVTDAGMGIFPEDMPRLFDRFYRSQVARQFQGLGLGLYIARMVVEAHGGRIWAENATGGGSAFTLTLPTGLSNPRASSSFHEPLGGDAGP